MITRVQHEKILQLVEELLIAQNNRDAEYSTGHRWEEVDEELLACKVELFQYLEALTE